MSRKKFYKRFGLLILSSVLSASLLVGCGSKTATSSNSTTTATSAVITTSLENQVSYDSDDAYSQWNESEVSKITLNETSIDYSGNGAKVNGSTITITSGGTYLINGKLSDGQIIIEAGKEQTVRLILNGVEVNCSNSAPMYVKSAKKVILSLEKGTTNTFTDGKEYVLADTSSDEPNSTIFSKDDLTINGSGTLTVNANYNNGITCKDDLKILDGTYNITSADDSIVGRDMVAVKSGTFKINATGDGIKSTNDTENGKGIIAIENGNFNLQTGADGIQSAANVTIVNGTYDIVTGGGSANATQKKSEMGNGFGGGGMNRGDKGNKGTMDGNMNPNSNGTPPAQPSGTSTTNSTEATVTQTSSNNTNSKTNTDTTTSDASTEETGSFKGIKATNSITITGGTFKMDTCDDAVHSNNNVSIKGGTLNITAGDDGVHADTTLNIAGGTIDITKSYEGLESSTINISDGKIHVTSSDDGVNVAGGNDGSSTNGRPGENSFSSSSNNMLNITGGYMVVNASGDGLDANGSIKMTGGTVVVYGPTNAGNGALDYDGTCDVTGGTLVAAGATGMFQSPSESSTEGSVTMTYSSTQKAGTIVRLEDKSGNEIITIAPEKDFQAIVIASPEIKNGGNYVLYTGGTSSSKATDGVYAKGAYTKAQDGVSFTTSSNVTYLNESGVTTGSQGNMGGGGGRGKRP